jgi:hypothetical protein
VSYKTFSYQDTRELVKWMAQRELLNVREQDAVNYVYHYFVAKEKGALLVGRNQPAEACANYGRCNCKGVCGRA